MGRGVGISLICVDRIKKDVRNNIHWQDSNLQPTAWARNSGEEKESLNHSATGHYIFQKDQQSTEQANALESHEKFCRDLN